jgi:hypothetical protein
MATTPVVAKPAPQSAGAKATCSVKLENAPGAAGYKMVRNCAKPAGAKSAGNLAIARQPVAEGSNFRGDSSTVLLPLVFVSAFVGGLIIAFGDGEGEGDGGGIDPASP